MGRKKAVEDETVDPREKYLRELRSLIKDIDADGLLFLISQANTLIYNQRIDELNREAEKISVSQPKKTGSSAPKKNAPVSIEKGAFGKSYIIDFQIQRKTFGEDEMLRLVQAASAGYDDADKGAARIFRWLQRNRDDVLLDLGIHTSRSPHLFDLSTALKATFRVRKS